MKSDRSVLTPKMVEAYCDKRLAAEFSADELTVIRAHLIDLLERNEFPTYRGSRLDVRVLANTLCLDPLRLMAKRSNLQPIFDAVTRSISETALRPEAIRKNSHTEFSGCQSKSRLNADRRKQRGKRPRPVVEFPEPLDTVWSEPASFGAALRLHAKRHGESIYHLYDALVRTDDGIKRSTFVGWGRRNTVPTSKISQDILSRIERRYRLAEGYFSKTARAKAAPTTSCELDEMNPAERRRLVWHLPDDFRRRPRTEQDEILAWVREVIISGSTEYRRVRQRQFDNDMQSVSNLARVHKERSLVAGCRIPRMLWTHQNV